VIYIRIEGFSSCGEKRQVLGILLNFCNFYIPINNNLSLCIDNNLISCHYYHYQKRHKLFIIKAFTNNVKSDRKWILNLIVWLKIKVSS